jgi:hypothetical protein
MEIGKIQIMYFVMYIMFHINMLPPLFLYFPSSYCFFFLLLFYLFILIFWGDRYCWHKVATISSDMKKILHVYRLESTLLKCLQSMSMFRNLSVRINMEQQVYAKLFRWFRIHFGMYLVIVNKMVSSKYVISTCFHLSKMQDGYLFCQLLYA